MVQRAMEVEALGAWFAAAVAFALLDRLWSVGDRGDLVFVVRAVVVTGLHQL